MSHEQAKFFCSLSRRYPWTPPKKFPPEGSFAKFIGFWVPVFREPNILKYCMPVSWTWDPRLKNMVETRRMSLSGDSSSVLGPTSYSWNPGLSIFPGTKGGQFCFFSGAGGRLAGRAAQLHRPGAAQRSFSTRCHCRMYFLPSSGFLYAYHMPKSEC